MIDKNINKIKNLNLLINKKLTKSKKIFNNNIKFNNKLEKGNRYYNKFENLYSIPCRFNINYFIEFLIYQLLYFLFFGPFLSLILLFLKGKKAKYYIHNMLLFEVSILNFINIFYWIMTIFNLYLFIKNKHELFEIYNYFIAIIFRILIISFKYSLYNKNKMYEFRNNYINKSTIYEDLLWFGWANKDKKIINKQFDITLKRLKINKSNFLISFMFDLNKNELKKLNLKKNNFTIIKINNKEFKYIKIYNIFEYLINKNKKSIYKNIIIFIFITYSSIKIGFTVYNIAKDNNLYENKIFYYTRYVIMFISITFYKSHLMMFYMLIIHDLYLIGKIIDGLIEILSIEKIKNKNLPTVNILDPFSIENWVLFKLLILKFGQNYLKRIKFQIGYIFVSIIIIFILFNLNLQFQSSEYELLNLFFNDILCLNLIFFIILVWSSNQNYKFIKEKDHLFHIQELIFNLKIFKKTYKENKNDTEKFNINRFNYIYLNCIEYFKNIYGYNFHTIFENHIDDEIDFLEKMIIQIDYYKLSRSYGIFGIDLNFNFVKLYVFGLLPLLINYMLNNYLFLKNN